MDKEREEKPTTGKKHNLLKERERERDTEGKNYRKIRGREKKTTETEKEGKKRSEREGEIKRIFWKQKRRTNLLKTKERKKPTER